MTVVNNNNATIQQQQPVASAPTSPAAAQPSSSVTATTSPIDKVDESSSSMPVTSLWLEQWQSPLHSIYMKNPASFENGSYVGNHRRGRVLTVIMAFAFMLLFTAFGPVQSLMTTIFPQYGKVSLSVLYFTYGLATIPSPAIVRNTGAGLACAVGSVGYVLWMGNSIIDQNWVNVIISAMLIGFGAALLWTSNGVLITENSTAASRGTNAGTFLAIYRCSGLIGNGLLTAFVNDGYSNTAICSVFTAIGAVGMAGLFFQWMLLRVGGGMRGRERLCPSIARLFFTPPPLPSLPNTPRAAAASGGTAPPGAASSTVATTTSTIEMPAIAGTDTFVIPAAPTPLVSYQSLSVLPIYHDIDLASPSSSLSTGNASPSPTATTITTTTTIDNHQSRDFDEKTSSTDDQTAISVVFHDDPTDHNTTRATDATLSPQLSSTSAIPISFPLPKAADGINMAVAAAVLVSGKNRPKLMSSRQRAAAVIAILFNNDMRHILIPCMAIYGLTQGWMNGSFTLLVGRSRLGPVMIVHGVAITISSFISGRLYDKTARKNLLVWFTLVAFLLSLILTYWAIQLESGSDGQVALWYIIVILYGTNLGGFEAFVFSTFGQLFGDRADIAFAARSVVQSISQAIAYLVLPAIEPTSARLSVVFGLDVLCVLYFLTWKPPASMRSRAGAIAVPTTPTQLHHTSIDKVSGKVEQCQQEVHRVSTIIQNNSINNK